MAATDEQPHIRVLTDRDVDAVVDRFISRMSERRTVEQITGAWGGVVDRAIGRGMRRLAFSVIGVLLLVGALKFDLFSKFTQ